jgi:hypothetical protein
MQRRWRYLTEESVMRRSLRLLVAALLASSALTVSVAGTALPSANPPTVNATDAAPTALAVPAVNAQLEKMQAAHAKLAAAKTAAERRLAMQEAMQVMQDSMHMMRGQTTENGCMGDMRMGMGHAQEWYGYADKNARPTIEHPENAYGPVS